MKANMASNFHGLAPSSEVLKTQSSLELDYPVKLEHNNLLSCDQKELEKYIKGAFYHVKEEACWYTQEIIRILDSHRVDGDDEPSQLASKDLSVSVLEVILKCIEPCNRLEVLSRQGGTRKETVFHFYLRENRIDAVKLVLDFLSQDECYKLQKIKDSTGWTALHTACVLSSKNRHVISMMREHVTEEQWYELLLKKINTGKTALFLAVAVGNPYTVNLLLNSITTDQSYQLLQMTESTACQTPIHCAAEQGYSHIVKSISKSVTVEQWLKLLQMRDCKSGRTPLHCAVGRKHLEVLETIKGSIDKDGWFLLLKLRDGKSGQTTLQYAKMKGYDHVVDLLQDSVTEPQWRRSLEKRNGGIDIKLDSAQMGVQKFTSEKPAKTEGEY